MLGTENALLAVWLSVQAAAADGRTPVLIFDLDETLLDSRPRTARIIHEYANEPAVVASYPRESKISAALAYEQISYELTDTMLRAEIFDENFVSGLNRTIPNGSVTPGISSALV